MPVSWQNLMDEAVARGGGSYEPLPVGDYSVIIDEASHTTSQSGKLMFKVKMKVQGGPHENRLVWNQFVISPESPTALSIFFSQMKTLGLTTEFFAAQPSEDAIVNALVGKCAVVTLQQREWQGQVRNEVKAVKPPTGTQNVVTTAPTASSTPAPASAPAATPTGTAPVAPF